MAATGNGLDDGFRTPPTEARSRQWWHWQDGFLNSGEMEKELAFMREAGLGGCQQFVAGWTRVPTNGEHLVQFMSDEWLGFSRRALKAASDNGLEYGLQNGAGWTGVGGPWMTTEKSMKHVFAVERRARGGAEVVLPPLGDGPYVPSASANDWRKPWYGDIRAFAFPTPKAYLGGDLPGPEVSSVPASPDLEYLFGRNTFNCHQTDRYKPGFVFESGEGGKVDPSLRFSWKDKVTIRSVWLKGIKDTENVEVWASNGGNDFRFVAKLSNGYVLYQDAYAGRFHSLPKTTCRMVELRWKSPCSLRIYEAGFSSRPTLTGFDDQCGRCAWNPFRREVVADEPEANLDPKDILDVTDRIAADGTLSFTPPADGRTWTVLRIAATSTRRTNQPTNPDMSGPACDILDADAVRFHLSQYIEKMLEAEKEVNAHTIGNVLLDSWEQGTANWSKNMPEEFRRRRGYDIAKYLPVFGGYFVGSRETSERFLWDFRRTVTEVVKDNFFGVIEDYCRERNLKHYVEGFACGSGTFMGDPMMAYLNCDVPMTESGSSVREAPSAAHLKGGKLVAFEAHTSAANWSRTPRDFKPREDAFFRQGITRIIYHGGSHNPKPEWRFPGLTFGGYGAEIPRDQTWAKYMRCWQDYLARCQFMLQRGAFVADVLAFIGEDYGGHVVGVYSSDCSEPYSGAERDRLVGLPPGLDYDLVNAEFLKELSVFGDGTVGYAKNPDATRYRALVLRERDFEVSVETARELLRLVKAGATVVGPKLVKSLGRPEAAKAADAEVAAIGEELAKSGRYLATIAELGLKPDFTAKNAVVARDVNYLHRREGETDIYYVVRWRRLGGDAQIGFKVTGKLPEIFNPLTGEISEAEEFYVKDGYTYMPAIPCDAKEATRFVVFRKPTTETERTAHGRETRIAQLNPEWTIRFKDELGVDTTIVTNCLFDWSKHCDPAIATFSGTAVYRTKVALPLGATKSDIVLNLGQVEELCEVIVNGQSCGVAWCEPYEVKVPRSLIADASAVDLEIRVVNSWHNRLLVDQQRPESERKTFTVRPPKADAKPVPSGLLGPLSLRGQSLLGSC